MPRSRPRSRCYASLRGRISEMIVGAHRQNYAKSRCANIVAEKP